MELSEGQDDAWCKIRSVLNPKSAPYNYPTLVSRDEGGIKRNVFNEEVKTDVDAELDQPTACRRLNFQKIITFDPDIHPDRIRFDEVTDILGKVYTRKPVARTKSPTKSYVISFPRCTSFSRNCWTSASSTAITLGPGREHELTTHPKGDQTHAPTGTFPFSAA